MADFKPQSETPLPPTDANVHTTACDYCIVACGYKVYTWPVGEMGGAKASENALGVDYPSAGHGVFGGKWVGPNQHGLCRVGGKDHHCLVLPDADATAVNLRGNHSIRGGCLALKPYHPDKPTQDRLKTPMLRVKGQLTPISWEDAFAVMAGISKHVVKEHGISSWGMKTFSYEFFENTYAISKIAFESMKTPAYAPHDKPGPGNDTAGIDDAGIRPFGTGYRDWAASDVMLISGTDPFETKTVLFTEWLMRIPKIIMVNPHRTSGAAYAERQGGLFLQITPGTDTILHIALARIILENEWEDSAFIKEWIASKWEIYSGFGRGTRNTPWQWRTTWGKLGTDYAGYKKWILENPDGELANASRLTGIPEEKIVAAAEMIAKPINGEHPKTSFAFEKGNYWSNNYLNTSSYSALALINGAGNRPGRRIGRLGGHQRGWSSKAAGYPRAFSPEKFQGRRKKEIDLDRWVEAGKLRFAWVIGTTWTGAMAGSDELASRMKEMTVGSPHQITSKSVSSAVSTLKNRVDNGGMVIVHQDIYLREPVGAEFADLILPASGWGEHDFARANGERRLRLYSKFCDAPGEARPDWKIIAGFGQAMGFEGYDWEESNDVFEEAARFSRGGVYNYHPLVWRAK
ncbi:molybdopterin-dependent oxidoreductase, partial [bacterium]|nr:molybdopterin-dependent oxidoreductase [bacterium]